MNKHLFYLKKLFILSLVLVLLSCTKNNNEITQETTTMPIKEETFHGIAMGYNDLIEVDVTIENDNIKNVVITKENETPGIGGPLKNNNNEILTNGGLSPITIIPNMIVDNQSINIDAVTGATATSYGILHAVSDALIKANYKVDAISAPTEKERPDINNTNIVFTDEEKVLYDKWMQKSNYQTEHTNQTTDVIVVGGGGAGLSAAISASEEGANVIIVEKNGEVGGNTLVCGAIYNAVDENMQNNIQMTSSKRKIIEDAINEKPINDEHKELINTVKNQLKDYDNQNKTGLFDSKEWFALQTYNGGDKIANLTLVKTLCYNAYDCLNWIKNIGVEFYDFISQGAGSLWERTHTNKKPMGTGFISNYLNNIKNNSNIKIITNTEVSSIIQNESNEITGVNCIDKYGNEFVINANKAVIITTGGFSANIDMLKEYGDNKNNWENITISNLDTTNRTTVSNGKGIIESLKVGADTTDLSEIQLLYLGNTKNGQLTKYPPRCVNGTDQIIFINQDGNRFTNECGRRDDICKSILSQNENLFYIIESADGDKYIDIYSDEFKSSDGFSLDYLIDNQYIYVANTIEELAQKINVDENSLKNTIKEFNDCVDGATDKYGRNLFTTKLENGPFIATPRKVSVHHTMGGLKINENANVLDKDNNVIKGLYAAGEVTGGIHGRNRLGGNAVVDTVVFGKIAGQNAAKEN